MIGTLSHLKKNCARVCMIWLDRAPSRGGFFSSLSSLLFSALTVRSTRII